MATISIRANTVRPSVDRRSEDTASGREHSHGKTQYIPGKQVLVRSWLWKIYYNLQFKNFGWPKNLFSPRNIDTAGYYWKRLSWSDLLILTKKRTPCPNVSTTPLRQWGFQQCLSFSWTTLRGKHCRHPIAVMGVVYVRALSANVSNWPSPPTHLFADVILEWSLMKLLLCI